MHGCRNNKDLRQSTMTLQQHRQWSAASFKRGSACGMAHLMCVGIKVIDTKVILRTRNASHQTSA